MRHCFHLGLPIVIFTLLAVPARGENLASEATYSVVLSGYVYRGQVIPGTNTPATTAGFMDAPLWQGPADTLVDGRRDGNAVRSWFWSAMKKRVTITFDLRRPANIERLGVWAPPDATQGLEAVTARIADSEAGLAVAGDVALEPVDSGCAWSGPPRMGRFVRLVCAGGAPVLAVSEVDIGGQAMGPVVADAPRAGLMAMPPRDLTLLVKAPAKPDGIINIAATALRVLVTSSHYDDKTGRTVEDMCAGDSDPAGRALVDGDPKTAISSFSGWYTTKVLTAEMDFDRVAELDRIVVWCPSHDNNTRVYLNAFQVWVRAGPDAAWEPAGECRNPILPGEKPMTAYPLASPPIGRSARSIRVQFTGVAQSGDVMRVAEIEVWAKDRGASITTTAAATAPSWRVLKAVPSIAPMSTESLAPAYDWIVRDRLRGLYGYSTQSRDKALLERARTEGFNCFIFHTSGPQNHSEQGWPTICTEWADVQKTFGMKVIASWAYGSDERYGNTRFGAYQPGGKEVWKRAPCPQSREYWDRVVGDRAVIAAKAGLTGMVIDMEMYGADATRYPGPCYCDTCWRGFVDEHLEGVSAQSIALRDRPMWISGNRLSADYARRQEIVVTGILRDIAKRVRAVKSDFLLGNLLDPESLPGLARGLGTPAMPALIFSELEYRGNLTGVPGRIAQLRSEGYPAIYLPGFWPQPVRADQLAALVCEAGTSSAGYWVWSSLAFKPDSKGEYACNKEFTPEDYWRAIRRGNDLLTAALKQSSQTALVTPATMPAPKGPRAVIPRTNIPPHTDQDWARGTLLGPFVVNNSGHPANARTTARLLWDGQRLHVRIMCDEPRPETMKPARGERDDSGLWTQDSVEVFWMRPNGRGYAHVIVNTSGTIFDALADGLKPEDIGWNADITAQACKTTSGWRLDLSLPLEADGMGPIKAGGELRFELARNRPGGSETTCWAPSRGMFIASTNLWGTLVLE